jgi:hypothetical protein
MADPKDQPFDPAMDDDDAQAEFERLSDLLLLHVTEFAEKQQLPDAILATMLMQIAVSTRMMAYVVAVDKPTSLGLKLDLDRFRRDIEESLREMKKRAEAFIIQAAETIAAAGREEAKKK